MSNDEIVKELTSYFGAKETLIYCKLHARVTSLIHSEEFINKKKSPPLESEYEKIYWNNMYKMLKNEKN